jgi:hypothetical protein
MPFLIALFLFLFAPLVAYAESLDAAATPYHVTAQKGRTVSVDLGQGLKAHQTITLIGKGASAKAVLQKTKQVCRMLCGDDPEGRECHREAVYRTLEPVPQGVKFVLAIPGSAVVKSNDEMIAFTPSQMPKSDFVGEAYQLSMRWSREDIFSNTYLEQEDVGKDWYSPPVNLDDCAVKEFRNFRKLECPAVNLLYSGTDLVTISAAEYSSGEMEVEFSLEINGTLYYGVRIAIKGRDGLYGLIRKENGKWRLYMTIPDYASLC